MIPLSHEEFFGFMFASFMAGAIIVNTLHMINYSISHRRLKAQQKLIDQAHINERQALLDLMEKISKKSNLFVSNRESRIFHYSDN